jgi:prevent-host-death family protein
MYMKVLPMSEARRRLPELVRKVRAGHPPIAIGRRGRAEAVLSRASSTAPTRRPLVGMVELVGSWDQAERASQDLGADIERGLEETERLLAPARPGRPRTRR